MRKAVLAAAVASGLVAVSRLRPARPARPSAGPVPGATDIPRQRGLAPFVEGDADLVLADQEAQDARVLQALDELLGR